MTKRKSCNRRVSSFFVQWAMAGLFELKEKKANDRMDREGKENFDHWLGNRDYLVLGWSYADQI